MIPEPKLNDLYQEVILDHNRRPRNFKEIPNPSHYSHGYNPLCGDDFHLYLRVEGGIIQDVGFKGQGCAISKSSASILTSMIKGKSLEDARKLAGDFIDFMVEENKGDLKSRIGRLSIYEGVKEFPVRVKCTTLIFHALQDAAKDS
ncbi:MAG: SUF system NifU family Fe-S cluster assembly protein [Candidatus Omnitrophica bacterium]|nr:SUF system NifU family Fe-S cluster assembly protein [Candidatus Omnitrophota bacterium]